MTAIQMTEIPDRKEQARGAEPSKAHDEDELLRLAEEVSDGRPVDWDSRPPSEGNTAQWIDNLRSLEAIAAAMRREPPPMATRTLEPGSRIGRFVVEGEARKGGMGVVYLARDETLDRPVALKLLPLDVAHSPERLARLGREARLLASMNHPNIATIYGLEDGGGGLLVLVLEWVPGETLADRLRGGPLPIRDALEVCGQIAQGLATAHAGGVIHRDLKPANVMFGHGDRVKVVDFGLARKRPEGGASTGDIDSSVAGTWGYLSPECLTGREDQRADVFAFGCVLFECLVGTPAFPGRTAEEIYDAVMHHEPDLARLPAQCAPAIRRIIAGCLQKNPEQRISSVAEVGRVIEATIGRRAGAQLAVPTNLPVSATSFVGRTLELEQYRSLLNAGSLLTLTGPGGAGKTRLAIALAQRVESELPGGAWFVDLAPVHEGTRAIEALSVALGVKSDPATPLFDLITRRLRETRALLIFDNCEHISEASAALARDLLESCPAVSIVATSRGPLRVAGEQVIRVDPLPVPADSEIDDPEALARCHSVCLFVERAMESNPAFVPDARALQSAGEICRRVEGLPLAIELAAARVRVLSLEEISSRLDRQLQLLRDGTGRMTPRHRALHATIGWSVDQLRPDEAHMFRALAVFSGGWDLAATTYVCAVEDEFDALDLISSLVDKSLVTVVPAKTGSTRYRFLEPIHQYAWESLGATGERSTATRRHLEYFLALAEEAESFLYGSEQGRWLERLSDEHANMLVALDECYRDPEGMAPGLRLAGALGRYWHVRGYAELGMGQLDRMLRRPGADDSSAPRARAAAMAGALASWRGDIPHAIAHLEDALVRFRELADRRGESRVLLALGPACCESGDTERGLRLCEEGLEAAREVGDLRGVATALVNLGVLAYGRGDRHTAHRLFGEAVDLHRQSGDRVTLAVALGNRSALSVQLGNFAAARSELTEALQLSLELDAVLAGTSAIGTASMLALTRGDTADAAWMLGAATECVESCGLTLSRSQHHQLEQLVSQVRGSLDESRFDQAWTNGRALPFPDAAARVVAWLSSRIDPT